MERPASVGWPDGETHLGGERLVRRIAQIRFNLNAPGFPIRPHIQVLDTDRRRGKQLHRIHNPTHVVSAAWADRITPRSMCRLAERDAVDGFACGIEHTHRQPVLRAGLDGRRHIQVEGIFRALVLADLHAIHPDLGEIIHRPKTQDETPVGMGLQRCVKLPPIPGDPVIVGEDILDNPRHARGFGALNWSLEPLLGAPDVRRVGGEQPAFAIERKGLRGLGTQCYALRFPGVPWRLIIAHHSEGNLRRFQRVDAARMGEGRPANQAVITRLQQQRKVVLESALPGQANRRDGDFFAAKVFTFKRRVDGRITRRHRVIAPTQLDHG